jgi:methionyl-tRNA synthetase
MSKSVGNVIAPQDLIDLYGLDQTRYLLMREVPHGQDGNFSHDYAIQRINSDLANGLGNLAQRTLSMIYKNCEGKIPTCGELTDADKKLQNHAHVRLILSLREEGDKMKFNRALEAIFKLVIEANGYVDSQAPWNLKKENPARMNTVLYVLAEIVRVLGLSMLAFTPESAHKILDQLKIDQNARDYSFMTDDNMLESGVEIDKPEGIFPRLEAGEKAA